LLTLWWKPRWTRKEKKINSKISSPSSEESQHFETVSSSSARLGTLTTGLPLRRVVPRISQPLLPHQLQRPLLDQVNRKFLSGRHDVATFLVLDPTEDYFHVIYLTVRALRFSAALLRVLVLVEIVHTRAPPPATRIGTEGPTREVKRSLSTCYNSFCMSTKWGFAAWRWRQVKPSVKVWTKLTIPSEYTSHLGWAWLKIWIPTRNRSFALSRRNLLVGTLPILQFFPFWPLAHIKLSYCDMEGRRR